MDVVTPEIIAAVDGIDYGCMFVDGKCCAVNARDSRGLKHLDQICCRSCARFTGYLKIKPSELPDQYLPYWDAVDGFLTPTGCGLPREMRSRRCIIYVCRDACISDANRAVLKELEETT